MENNSRHIIIMVIVHVAPLLLFLILPKFNISSQLTLVLVILLIIVTHIWMIKAYSHHYNNLKYKKLKVHNAHFHSPSHTFSQLKGGNY
jgi:hypothetical protein